MPVKLSLALNVFKKLSAFFALFLINLPFVTASHWQPSDNVTNSPVAHAGYNQTVEVGQRVYLSGQHSISPDQEPLFFTWELEARPNSSQAVIYNPSGVSPYLDIDAEGDYKISLMVNDGENFSLPDSLVLSTINSVPVAIINSYERPKVGTKVFLDGSHSIDPDGDLLNYHWELVSKPANSETVVLQHDMPLTSIVLDVSGVFVVCLVVSDTTSRSEPDCLPLDSAGNKPKAHVTKLTETVIENDGYFFSAENSTDLDGDLLEYRWALVHKPFGSKTDITRKSAVLTSFLPDIAGHYLLQLTVTDENGLVSHATYLLNTFEKVPDIETVSEHQVYPDVEFSISLTDRRSAFLNVQHRTVFSTSKDDAHQLYINSDLVDARLQTDAEIIIQSEYNLLQSPPSYTTRKITTRQVRPLSSIQLSFPEKNVPLGEIVSLNVLNDQVINTVAWSLLHKPKGSQIVLSSPEHQTLNFSPDMTGDYVFQLQTKGSYFASKPETIRLHVEDYSKDNLRPFARVNPPVTIIELGRSVKLSGGQSSDPEGKPLNYEWSMLNSPQDSTIALENFQSSIARIKPDIEGEYHVRLIVNDGRHDSLPATAIVQAMPPVNRSPTMEYLPTQYVLIDETFSFQVIASDPDGDALTYSIANEPLGMQISEAGHITWLPRKDTTETVIVTVSDGELFDSKELLISVAGGIAQTPVFKSVADQIVPLGTRLEFTLEANDLQGKSVTYQIAGASLPDNMSLNVHSGLFVFKPGLEQVGRHNLSFIASNGRFSAFQTVTIEVPPPGLHTSLSGRVLTPDSNGDLVGFEGVRLEMRGVEVHSDADGYFTLANLPEDDSEAKFRLMVDGSGVPPGGLYAQVPEIIPIIEGAENVMDANIVLLPLDVASADYIDPERTSVITSSPIRIKSGEMVPITLTIPPHTAYLEETGELFEGYMHISEVGDSELGPQPLPPEYDLSVYIAKQPFGIVYKDPVPISFPNKEGHAPGVIMDIYALNHATGRMEKEGEARVSEDGLTVDSIGGVVRGNSWCGIVAQPEKSEPYFALDQNQPTAQPLDELKKPDSKCCPFNSKQCCQGKYKDCTDCAVDKSTGNLSEWHSVPGYYSLGQERSFSIEYNSSVAVPRPIFNQVLGFGNENPVIPVAMSSELSVQGIEVIQEKFREIRVEPGEIIGQYREMRPSYQFDAHQFSTGIYNYQLITHFHNEDSRRANILNGQIIIENQVSSPIGAGWTISGLQRLYQKGDGAVLITTGTASSHIFRVDENAAYQSPPGDFSRLERLANGNFIRTSKYGIRYEFNSDGLMISETDRNQNRTTYIYDEQQRLSDIEDPVGKRFSLSYKNGMLHSVTDPLQRTTVFEHEHNGNLKTIIEPNDDTRSFEYQPDKPLMIAQTDQRGNRKTYTYSSLDRIKSTTSADQMVTHYAVSEVQGVLISDSGGSSLEDLAEAPPLVDEVLRGQTDKNGNPLSEITDARNAPTKITDALNRIYTIKRDPQSNPEQITRPNGSVVNQTFDDKGNLRTSFEEEINALVERTYDEHSLLKEITNPNGHTTTYVRDDQGNVEAVINELGHTTTMTYDQRGLIKSLISPNQLLTEYEYDADGLIKTITQTPPNNSQSEIRVTHYTYDKAGQIKSIVTPDLVKLELDYDSKGRLTEARDNLNQEIKYYYDAANNLIEQSSTNSDGSFAQRLKNGFDVRNRHISVSAPHENNLNSVTRFNLDGNSNVTQVIAPESQVSEAKFDAEDRLIKSTHRLNGETHYSYDSNDRPLFIIAPNGVETQYTWDKLGRQESEVSPDRGAIRYQYDAAHNLVRKEDGRGVVTKFDYDELERLIGINYPANPHENVTYDWDDCPFGIGRICRISDESGIRQFAYDVYGNLISQVWLVKRTRNAIQSTYVTSYRYDNSDQITQIKYPSGRVVNIERDALRRIASVSAEVNKKAEVIVSNMKYRADNLVLQCEFGNGLKDAREYDLQGRLQSQSLGAVDNRVYEYDLNSNIRLRNSTPQKSKFDVDLLDRIAEDQIENDEPHRFSYDLNDNRLSKLQSDYETDKLTYSFGSNRLIARTHFSQNQLLPMPKSREMKYNDANRLSSIKEDGEFTVQYLYQDDGLRTHKIFLTRRHEKQAVIHYHYDIYGRLIAETNNDGELIREYLWLDDYSPVTQIENNQGTEELYYLHTDHLMTPRLATNEDGNVVWRWDGEAFGETPAVSSPLNINLRFPGQYFDSETGNHYNWNRYYDASLGRYLQSDPIGLSGGLNTYGYGDANPQKLIDPLGLDGIYIHYDEYPINTGLGFNAPFGHAGVISLDPVSGSTRYYEYGRYNGDFGVVRSRRIPDVVIGEDGKPTSESLKRLYDFLSENYGKDRPVSAEYYKDANHLDIIKFAENLINDQSRAQYSWNPFAPNHCKTFAREAIDAGRN